jgi:hypothetical protein
VTTRAGISTRQRERLFYIGMAAAVVLTVFAGFARTYYLRPLFADSPLPALLHLHGIVFTAWVALFVTQTALVATNRVRVHRRLGVAGGVLAALMLVVGAATALIRAKAGAAPPGGPPPLVFLVVPLGDLLVFGTLVGVGLHYRRRPDVHKRLMLLAMIAILPAAIARLPFAFIQQAGPLAFFGLADLLILVCLAYDVVARGRPHRATVLGGLFLAASHPIRLMIGGTAAWLAFADWLTSLVA